MKDNSQTTFRERYWGKLEPVFANPWIVRCGASACPLRGRRFPAVATRFSGIFYGDRWYHQAACMEDALTGQLERLLFSVPLERRKYHRLPFGLLLVRRGAITPAELRDALERQRQAGYGRLSQWLDGQFDLQETEIAAVLAQQWGCPVYPLQRGASLPTLASAPPYPLFSAAQAVPVHCNDQDRRLLIAFCQRVDYSLLYALDEMLGCKSTFCAATTSAVREALEGWRQRSSGQEISFDSMRKPAEMAATIASYAAQLEARSVRIVRAGGYVWSAFFRSTNRRDVLFRIPALSSPALDEFARDKAFALPVDKRKQEVPDATVVL